VRNKGGVVGGWGQANFRSGSVRDEVVCGMIYCLHHRPGSPEFEVEGAKKKSLGNY